MSAAINELKVPVQQLAEQLTAAGKQVDISNVDYDDLYEEVGEWWDCSGGEYIEILEEILDDMGAKKFGAKFGFIIK